MIAPQEIRLVTPPLFDAKGTAGGIFRGAWRCFAWLVRWVILPTLPRLISPSCGSGYTTGQIVVVDGGMLLV